MHAGEGEGDAVHQEAQPHQLHLHQNKQCQIIKNPEKQTKLKKYLFICITYIIIQFFQMKMLEK